jgi:hypothetical protein
MLQSRREQQRNILDGQHWQDPRLSKTGDDGIAHRFFYMRSHTRKMGSTIKLNKRSGVLGLFILSGTSMLVFWTG